MDLDLSEFYDAFFEECSEGLEVAEAGLLQLASGEADSETINGIFRAVHSMKGGAGTFGFMDLSNFAHIAETVLDEVRDNKLEATSDVVDALLASIDVLKMMVECTQNESEFDQDQVAGATAKLQVFLDGDGHGASAPAAAEAPTTESPDEAAPAPSAAAPPPPQEDLFDESGSGWRIVFAPAPEFFQNGNDCYRVLRELTTLGELTSECDLSALPPYAEMKPEECTLAWKVRLESTCSKSAVEEIFAWVTDTCDLSIEPFGLAAPTNPDFDLPAAATPAPAALNPAPASTPSTSTPAAATPAAATPAPVATAQAAAAPAPAKKSKAPEKKKKAASAGSIRVSTDKVDALVNLIGELVITEAMLNRFADGEIDPSQFDELRDGLNQLMRNTRELQETAMRIRMLPISTCFNRFPRVVRDLSATLGKKIDLEILGGHTELDKTILEKINDPLVHLVRNALDHGIETPEKRKAAGKSETGKLTLDAFHEGGNIIIEVRDDGAGLNRERIVARAVERGLIGPDDDLPDEQVWMLIFQAGFSTAEVVSDVSGRGVGMDVVRRNINDLGGSVQIQSFPGQGSTLRIRLPLTLAILDGQLVSIEGQVFIIPLLSIIESLTVDSDLVNIVAGKNELYRLRDQMIPIIRLGQAYRLTGERKPLENSLLVVVESDGKQVGLLVDDLLGQQQVVIKSLEANFRGVQGLSGATILGDGKVALIADVPGIVNAGQVDSKELRTAAVA